MLPAPAGADGLAQGVSPQTLSVAADSLHPEWKDKVATPAFQEYYSGAIGLGELRKRLEEDGNLVLARYRR